MSQLSNHTYDEITLGQTATYTKSVQEQDVQMFAAVSGDANPVHLDPDFARNTQFGERIAHGMLTGAYISAALAMELPGPGTIYLNQSLRFRLPVKLGDTLTVKLEVTDKKDRRKLVTLSTNVYNQDEKLVAAGSAEVMAPVEKLTIDAPALPIVSVQNQT